MAFSHGKNARHFVDQFELTSYFNEFTMSAKAGTAETTVYGKGAKTFIGGLKEGTVAAKGYFDPGAVANDQEVAAALGRNTNAAVTHILDGSQTVGTRLIVAFAAFTDYTISSPVAGVNAVNYSAQADSGLSTGVLLFSSVDAALSTVGTTGTAATTVAAGSNAVNTNTFTGSGTLNVAATAGFNATGSLIVATGTTPAVITYTGLTGTTYTGCKTVFGGGVLSTGGNVDVGTIQASAADSGGFVSNLHVITCTGTGQTFTAKIQHSSDGHTWADLCSFNAGGAITAAGAFSAFVTLGTTINIYQRAVINTTGSTGITLNALVAGANQ